MIRRLAELQVPGSVTHEADGVLSVAGNREWRVFGNQNYGVSHYYGLNYIFSAATPMTSQNASQT